MLDTSERVKEAYDEWSEIYDTNENPTRDLNARTLREAALLLTNKSVLEIGCGTGLNTRYLARHASEVVGLDISKEMLAAARQRFKYKKVRFVEGDITKPWKFEKTRFDFIVANLVLEHVRDLSHIFHEAGRVLGSGGRLYIAELHPYKQLRQSQAKYVSQKTGKEILVDAFTHPVSEYINEGLNQGFNLRGVNEYQNEEDEIPRLLTLLFEKK